MTNEKFYNAEVKEQYFETFNNIATKETTEYAFKKAKNTEEKLKKDIYEMNIDELGDLLSAMSASTTDSAYNYACKFEYYIDWATVNGHRKTNINPFSEIDDRRKWAEQFVATRKKSLFTRDEILDMCEQLVNYPDRALLLAIFEGIGGEGFSELLKLQTKDLKEIDDKFYATLTNKDGTHRTIEISDKLFYFLHKADTEEVYYNKNGESDSIKSSESQFVDSPFIFKKLARGRKDGDIDAFYVRRKFQMFKDLFGAKFLTAKEIANSGMLHMVNEFYKQNGVVTDENWEQIAEQYDTSFIKYQGEYVRNILVLKRKASEKIFEEKYGYSLNVLA